MSKWSAVLVLVACTLVPGQVWATNSAFTATCQLERPDTSVFGIVLADASSARDRIGDDYAVYEDAEGATFAQFASDDGQQTLALIPHTGGDLDSFAEAEVSYGKADDNQDLGALPTPAFETASGIALGIRMDDVIAKLGECYRRLPTDTGDEVLLYERASSAESAADASTSQSDASVAPVDDPAAMPAYYAEYEFADGKLIRFRFGYQASQP